MKYLIILSLLFSSYGFSQNIATFDKDKGKVKAKPLNTTNKSNALLKNIADELTGKTETHKETKLYAIYFRDSNGNDIKKPSFIYKKKGEDYSSLKKRAQIQETGYKIKLGSLPFLFENFPEGLVYSKTKNGKTKYYLSYDKTKEDTKKKCKQVKESGFKCIEYKSLN